MAEPLRKQDRVLFLNSLLSILEKINTPISLGISLRVKWNVPIDCDVNPHNYLDPDSYLNDVQALALFKKNPWVFPGDKERLASTALANFLDAEARCLQTNLSFPMTLKNFKARSVLERSSQIIARILGDFDWGNPAFGPGSSSACRGERTDLVTKLWTSPECTPLAYANVIHVVLNRVPHYAISSGLLSRDRTCIRVSEDLFTGPPRRERANPFKVNVIKGNRFTTVPKDWRTDRPICVEPHGNMFLQKGLGSLIRERLKKFSLDLSIVPDLHKELARESSINDRYATIDLKSASDTISKELVKFLLPTDWYDALNSVRSHYTELPDGTWIHNEKFSSMGNGFTFELETLLFYSIALSIREIHGKPSDLVSVFGDDIIISKHLGAPMVSSLEVFGFVPNIEKTFLSGSFKESCGGDFFLGVAVRPIYIKELPDDRTLALVFFANRVRLLAHNLAYKLGCDSRFRSVWLDIVRRIPGPRLFGPLSLGDCVLSNDEYGFIVKDGYLRLATYAKVTRNRKIPDVPDLMLACALYGIPSQGLVSRGSKYTVRKRYVSIAELCCSELGWL